MGSSLMKWRFGKALLVFFFVALVMLWEWPVLWSSFKQLSDDPKFLRIMRPLVVADIPVYLGTNWGWVYRPVYLVYFAGMLRVAGPNPLAFHAFSICVHLLNCALLSWLCWRLLEAHDNSRRRLLSLACGAVFFFWVGRSESISVASCTSTLLCVLFTFLSLHAFLSWRQSYRWIAASACLIALAFALGSKEEAVVLPALCLVMDVCFLQGKPALRPRNWWIYGGMAILLAAFIWASLHAQAAISLTHPKIVTVPRAISPLVVVEFYLSHLGLIPLTWHAFTTPFIALNVALFLAVASLVYRRREATIRGAFWLSLLVCVPIPLMTGRYSLDPGYERFHYLPWAFLFLLVAIYLNENALRLPKLFPILAAAMTAAIGRDFIQETLLANPYLRATEDLNFLAGDIAFVPAVLVVVSLLCLWLWKRGVLPVEVVTAVVSTAVLTQLSVALPPGSLRVGLLVFSCFVSVVQFHRCRSAWGAALLVAVALWDMPAVTLPLFVAVVVASKAPLFGRVRKNEPVLLFSRT